MKSLYLIFAAALFLFASGTHAASPVLLFDQAHGQRFVVEKPGELSLYSFAEVMKAAGFDVRSTDKPITKEALTGVAALVTSGGFVPFGPSEIDAISEFLNGGGGLAVMLHIAPTYESLLKKFHVAATTGVIRETDNVLGVNSLDFTVKNLAKHPLTNGVESFVVRGGWGVLGLSEDIAVIADTSKGAWIDLNRNNMRDPAGEPLMAISVAVAGKVGSGKIAVFGDDAIFQDKFMESGNRKLAENIALWLMGKI